MRHTVKLPKLGETVDEVVVIDWLVDVGQSVSAGDAVLVVETDKIETEVETPVSGTVIERLVDVEGEVATGAPILVIDSKGGV